MFADVRDRLRQLVRDVSNRDGKVPETRTKEKEGREWEEVKECERTKNGQKSTVIVVSVGTTLLVFTETYHDLLESSHFGDRRTLSDEVDLVTGGTVGEEQTSSRP